jgi:single-stranded DNA-binding protein
MGGREELVRLQGVGRSAGGTRQAQFAEDYVRMVDRVYIEGRLEYDSYERDGVTISTAEIIVKEVVLLTAKVAAVDVAWRTRRSRCC